MVDGWRLAGMGLAIRARLDDRWGRSGQESRRTGAAEADGPGNDRTAAVLLRVAFGRPPPDGIIGRLSAVT